MSEKARDRRRHLLEDLACHLRSAGGEFDMEARGELHDAEGRIERLRSHLEYVKKRLEEQR